MRTWIAVVMAGITTTLAIVAVLLVTKLHRPGAGLNDVEITIDRPPSQVFAWFTDVDRVKQWVGGLTETSVLGSPTESRVHAGSRLRMTMVLDGERTNLDEEVTLLDAPKRLILRLEPSEGAATAKAFTEKADWTFEDLGGRTTVHVVARTQYRGLIALMEPWITSAAEKKLTEDLVRLKNVVEAEAKRASR
jgi:uncharacterized protein YndB with AHSA1/START domain